MADHAQLRLGDAEVDELPAAALGVDDDAVEAVEERAPHRRLASSVRRGMQVVRREDGGAARAEEPAVQLRRAEPLHVEDVRLRRARSAPSRAGARAPSRARRSRVPPHARRERIEPLARVVSLGRGDGAEAKARRDELDVGSRASERGAPASGRTAACTRADRRGRRASAANVRRGVGRIPRVTFEEARAQFPVLERYAYLQAGSVGPLARGTIEAMRADEERGAPRGRGALRAVHAAPRRARGAPRRDRRARRRLAPSTSR